MTKDTFILLAQPEQLRQLQGWDAVPAHLAYRIGRGPHLFRAGSGPVPQGGLMVVADQDFDGLGPSAPLLSGGGAGVPGQRILRRGSGF